MKKIFIYIVSILLLLLSTNAYADNFQFTSNSAYASSANIEVLSNNNVIFKGTTDKLGRISINLNNGAYECKVSFEKKQLSAKIVIDGKKEIKVVNLT